MRDFNQVFSYIQRLVGDVAQAHRLTETSYEQLARYYRRGRAPKEPRAMLYFLATSRTRDYMRRGQKKGIFQRLTQREHPPAVEFTQDHIRGLAGDTSQRALSTLDFNDKVVLLLHDYCGLNYAEVARASGVGRSAVPRDLDRARHAFKQAYDYIKF